MLKYFFHKQFKTVIIALLLIVGCFLIYKAIYPNPRTWYDHYLYLAKSLLQSRTDTPTLPSWYQDAVFFNGKTYLPFPPGPAVIIIPFIVLVQNMTQQTISVLIGAINVGLIYLLIKRLKNNQIASIVSVFYGLGTVAFWASIVGTTWYFAHTVGVLFLSLSLLCHFSKKDYLSGLFFAIAVLCRYPIALAGIFFFFQLKNDYPRIIRFTLGALPLIPIHFAYNWIRFGSITEMGYLQVYEMYTKQNYAYSIINIIKPTWPSFGYLDLRNIPLHLVNFLILPPLVAENFLLKPSPYGIGLIFSSPLLLVTLLPHWRDKLLRNIWLGAVAVAFAEFLHYSQGWVQWGYRFSLDFMPFLLILLAYKFRFNKLYIFLFLVSIIINFWGVTWAINLGW